MKEKELESLVIRAMALDVDIAQKHEAFGELVTLFQDMVFGCAYALLDDFHLAQDAAQEAFINAYIDLPKLRDPKAFAGWLRRIVIRQCHRIRRKKSLPTEPIETAMDLRLSEHMFASLRRQTMIWRQTWLSGGSTKTFTTCYV